MMPAYGSAITEARLLAYSMWEPMSGCLLWIGAWQNGYGTLRTKRLMVKAHRAAWQVWRGPLSDSELVLHKCDTPPCINPGHLFLGDHAINAQDRNRKGRNAPCRLVPMPGERNPNARLTEAQAQEIRVSRGPLKLVARHFGVTLGLVSQIRRGRAWSHLNAP